MHTLIYIYIYIHTHTHSTSYTLFNLVIHKSQYSTNFCTRVVHSRPCWSDLTRVKCPHRHTFALLNRVKVNQLEIRVFTKTKRSKSSSLLVTDQRLSSWRQQGDEKRKHWLKSYTGITRSTSCPVKHQNISLTLRSATKSYRHKIILSRLWPNHNSSKNKKSAHVCHNYSTKNISDSGDTKCYRMPQWSTVVE